MALYVLLQPNGNAYETHGLVTIRMKPDAQGRFGFNVKVRRFTFGTTLRCCTPRTALCVNKMLITLYRVLCLWYCACRLLIFLTPAAARACALDGRKLTAHSSCWRPDYNFMQSILAIRLSKTTQVLNYAVRSLGGSCAAPAVNHLRQMPRHVTKQSASRGLLLLQYWANITMPSFLTFDLLMGKQLICCVHTPVFLFVDATISPSVPGLPITLKQRHRFWPSVITCNLFQDSPNLSLCHCLSPKRRL